MERVFEMINNSDNKTQRRVACVWEYKQHEQQNMKTFCIVLYHEKE